MQFNLKAKRMFEGTYISKHRGWSIANAPRGISAASPEGTNRLLAINMTEGDKAQVEYKWSWRVSSHLRKMRATTTKHSTSQPVGHPAFFLKSQRSTEIAGGAFHAKASHCDANAMPVRMWCRLAWEMKETPHIREMCLDGIMIKDHKSGTSIPP